MPGVAAALTEKPERGGETNRRGETKPPAAKVMRAGPLATRPWGAGTRKAGTLRSAMRGTGVLATGKRRGGPRGRIRAADPRRCSTNRTGRRSPTAYAWRRGASCYGKTAIATRSAAPPDTRTGSAYRTASCDTGCRGDGNSMFFRPTGGQPLSPAQGSARKEGPSRAVRLVRRDGGGCAGPRRGPARPGHDDAGPRHSPPGPRCRGNAAGPGG